MKKLGPGAVPFAALLALTAFFIFLPLQSSAENLSGRLSGEVRRMSSMPSSSLISRGDRYAASGHADSALVCYMIVCNRSSCDMSSSEKRDCAVAHLRAGKVYYSKGSYSDALSFYVKGLKTYESCKEKRKIGQFYNNIGIVYCIFTDYEKGLDYYRKGYSLCRKYGDKETERKLLINMTGVCTFIGDTREAYRYYRLYEQMARPSGAVDLFMSRFNLGLIISSEGKHLKALYVFRSLADFSVRKKMSPRYLCAAYQQIYKSYMSLNRVDSAFAYLRLCKFTAEKNNIVHEYVEVYKDYADLYEKAGDMALANILRARYLKYKDSIFNQREFDVVKNVQFRYEMEKINGEIAALHDREKDSRGTIRLQRILMLFGGVVLFVTAAFLVVVYRQKRCIDRSYSDLFAVNRNFIASHERMKNVMRELRDRLVKAEDGNGELRKHQGNDGGEAAKYRSSNLDEDRKAVLVEAIVNVMENTTEFCSPDFSLDKMAALVGSNTKYVSQAINDTFHKNFSNYVNEYRVHLACLRLADHKAYGNFTIKGIAESVGFKSYTVFVTVIRMGTGIMPILYQEKAKENVR